MSAVALYLLQTAEYLLDKGLLDLVVPRSFLKGALFEVIDFYKVNMGACCAVLLGCICSMSNLSQLRYGLDCDSFCHT